MTLVEEQVDLPTPSSPMRTYVYRPSGPGRFPGVVLYSEIFQQTGPIRRSALMIAGHGYLVAVPEIFHDFEPLGAVLPYDPSGTDKGNRYKYDTPLGTFDADARVALDHLAGHPACTGALGSVGFCLGGHLAFRAAFDPRVRASACFYATDIHTDSLGRGKKSDTLPRMAEITGEVAMVWGRQDPHVPEDGRGVIRDALRRAGVNHSWHELNAVHAFMRDEGPRYDPALARLGYGLALELFERRLKVG